MRKPKNSTWNVRTALQIAAQLPPRRDEAFAILNLAMNFVAFAYIPQSKAPEQPAADRFHFITHGRQQHGAVTWSLTRGASTPVS